MSTSLSVCARGGTAQGRPLVLTNSGSLASWNSSSLLLPDALSSADFGGRKAPPATAVAYLSGVEAADLGDRRLLCDQSVSSRGRSPSLIFGVKNSGSSLRTSRSEVVGAIGLRTQDSAAPKR